MAERFILFDEGPEGGMAAFADPSELIVAWEASEVAEAFNRAEAATASGKWLAGYASYELGYVFEERLAAVMPTDRRAPLVCFGVFDGFDAGVTQDLEARGRAEQHDARLAPPRALWSEAEYEAAFDRVQGYIAAGDFYQTNLTFPMQSRYEGSALGLAAALRAVQPVGHGVVVDMGVGPVLVSRSPELFFEVDASGKIETRPMKGTVPRGDSAAEDAQLVAFLGADEKNRAENLMIVDLLRNDISRIATVGSVRVPELFKVETYATVHQMVSTVRAQILPDVGLGAIFRALFPCGSITGAPKLRAMEVIRDLEGTARDVYCGSIGWVAPNGAMRFNVAIRTLMLGEGGDVRLNVGGGVVYDSTAASEYEEALWKARYTKLS